MISVENKEVAEVFIGFLSTLFVIVSGWFMWEKQRAREELESHSIRLTKIESEMMTESKTKDLISEQLDPLKDDITELKTEVRAMASDVVEIKVMMAESRGYYQAKGGSHLGG